MRISKFSYFQSLRFAWETWKHNFWYFVGVIVLFFVVSWIPFLIAAGIGSIPVEGSAEAIIGLLVFLFYVAGYVIEIILGIGLVKILLNFCDGHKSPMSTLFKPHGVFWRFLGGIILYGLLVFAGFLLLIIPGIYWAIRYMFVPFLIIDKNMRIGEAFRRSSQLTKNAKWNIIVYGIFLNLLNLGYLVGILLLMGGFVFLFTQGVLGLALIIVGALLTIASFFITLPLIYLSYAHAYRTMAYTTDAGYNTDPQKGVAISNGEHAFKIVLVVLAVLGIVLTLALSAWAIRGLTQQLQGLNSLSGDFAPYAYPSMDDSADLDYSAYLNEDGSVDFNALQEAYDSGAFGGFEEYDEALPVEVEQPQLQ